MKKLLAGLLFLGSFSSFSQEMLTFVAASAGGPTCEISLATAKKIVSEDVEILFTSRQLKEKTPEIVQRGFAEPNESNTFFSLGLCEQHENVPSLKVINIFATVQKNGMSP